MEEKGLRYVKCVYKRDDQEKMMINVIRDYVSDIKSKFNATHWRQSKEEFSENKIEFFRYPSQDKSQVSAFTV